MLTNIPTVFTKNTLEKIDQVVKSIALGKTAASACKEVELDWNLFFTWRNQENRNEERVQFALASRNQIVEDCLFQNCLKGKESSIFFYLTRRLPERWPSDAKVQSQLGSPTSKIEIIDYAAAREHIKKIQSDKVEDANTE